MVWDGLWDNTCPSIDKKKEEKKAPALKIIGELLSALSISAFIMLVGLLLLHFVAWLLGVPLVTLATWLVLLVIFPVSLIGFTVAAIKATKIRIACIKAYWRKAKEACE